MAQGACISDLPSVLRRWMEPGCHLALWQRQLAPEVVRRLDRVPYEALPSARLRVNPENVGRRLEAALLASPLDDAALRAALAHDMAHLVMLFANATASQEAEVRIEAVRGDACRRYHAGVTHARLVTTYMGPGTVWVPPEHAEDAVRLQDEYSGPISQMPRFSVGMFGGSAGPGGGLVHRSPRIAGTGKFRLFFCVNRASRVATKLH
jgi:hypothetical protein